MRLKDISPFCNFTDCFGIPRNIDIHQKGNFTKLETQLKGNYMPTIPIMFKTGSTQNICL